MPQDGLWSWLGLIWTTLCGYMVGCISFGYGVVLPTLMVDLNENRERTGKTDLDISAMYEVSF